MDFQMFQKHAFRTVNKDLKVKEQLGNMALGMFDELGEVHTAVLKDDVDAICDEIGDVFWYAANLCTILEFELGDFYYEPKGDDEITHMFSAYRYAAILGGAVKKHCYHGHELDVTLVHQGLFGVVASLVGILNKYKLPVKQVLEGNQIKLMKRYPNGFEVERSVNRDEQVQE